MDQDCQLADATDLVIEEIDVFLSQDYVNNLYIFQYPLRPTWRQYNLSGVSSIAFHPSINHVSMSLPTQTNPDDVGDYANTDSFEDSDVNLTLKGIPINEYGPYAVGSIQSYNGANVLILHPVVAHLMFTTSRKMASGIQTPDSGSKQAGAGKEEVVNLRALSDVSTLLYTQEVPLRHFDQGSMSSKELYMKLNEIDSMFIQSAPSIMHSTSLKTPRLVTYITNQAKYLSSFSVTELHEREQAMLLNERFKTILDSKRRIEYCIREFRIVNFRSLRQAAQILGKEPPSHELIYSTLASRTVFIHGWFAIKSEFIVTSTMVPFLDYLFMLLGLNTTGLSDPNSLLHRILKLKETVASMQDQNRAYLGLLNSVEKQQENIIQQVLQAYTADDIDMCRISRKAFTIETGLPASSVLLMFRETGFLLLDKMDPENNAWRFKKDKQKDLGELPPQDAEREIGKWIDMVPAVVQAMTNARKLNKLRKLQDQGLVRDTLTDVTELPRDVVEHLFRKYNIE